MTIKTIPDGYHSVTPYLSIKGAAQAIEFYKRAFSATELFRLVAPSGEIGHAEIKIGDSPIMLADPCEEGPFRNPQSLGGSSVGLHVYVEDVDALFVQAVDAGAKAVRPCKTSFMVTAPVLWKILLAMFGFSLLTRKTSPLRKSTGVPRRFSNKAARNIARHITEKQCRVACRRLTKPKES